MTQHQVCILGGSGFVGRHLAARLNELKINCKVLTRRRESRRELLVLPYCELIEADIYRLDVLRSHFQSSTAVINLVGILNETGHDGHGFRKAHVELSRLVLQAAQQTSVRQILHMSALHADAAKGRSFYLRTKGEAEDYLHTFHGTVKLTSFCPSVIFGPGDGFFNRFAELLRMSPVVFPLPCANSKFAPVYVGDVVDQFIQALTDCHYNQTRVNLCGPEIYTLKQLVEFTADTIGLRRKVIALPNFIAKTQALLMEYFVPTRPFTLDNYYSLQTDSTCPDGRPMPTGIRAIVPSYLGKQDQRGQYRYYRENARR